jgi:hypothetical protein
LEQCFANELSFILVDFAAQGHQAAGSKLGHWQSEKKSAKRIFRRLDILVRRFLSKRHCIFEFSRIDQNAPRPAAEYY